VWHAIAAEGRTLKRVREESTLSRPWAAGPLLPIIGRSVWTVRVELASEDCIVGVCDTDSLHAWGLSLRSGKIVRTARTIAASYSNDVLPGWPDGRGLQIILGMKPHEMAGARVDVLIDHDVGALGFRINAGALHTALMGFPEGLAGQMRPWALLMHPGDRVTFEPGFVAQG
jgi:hypothetical protein